eukprot:364280-Chlamydomonas_euryale.AAC.3
MHAQHCHACVDPGKEARRRGSCMPQPSHAPALARQSPPLSHALETPPCTPRRGLGRHAHALPVARRAAAAAAGYPPPGAAELQRYQAMFMQLDNDRDGIVQGADCFSTFLQFGLEKVGGRAEHTKARRLFAVLRRQGRRGGVIIYLQSLEETGQARQGDNLPTDGFSGAGLHAG